MTESLTARLDRAEALSKNDDYVGALRLVDAVIADNPTSYEAYEARSSIHFQSGDVARAIDDVDQVIRLRPEAAAPHFRKGRYLMRMGRAKEAAAEFSAAIKLDQAYFGASAFFYRAEARLAASDCSGALEDVAQLPVGYSERSFVTNGLRTAEEIARQARSKISK